ncbi:MAG: matrixin family metalloprotease [Planctomycetota bacterium]
MLAYAETTGSGNWRMRFYTSWNWSDGPGNVAFNEEDMQSVATHEYGHCLGLGHSATTSATMYASYPGGTAQRSIATDDANGVKASTASPRPTSRSSPASVPGHRPAGHCGSNFGASNEVWFTREDFTGNGIPVKLTGVASTGGGTQITVNVPAAVRPGDILVRNSALTGHFGLSNAWPFDTDSVQCPGSVQICAGFPNSTGAAGQVFIFGSQSVAANDTVLTAQSLPVGQFAMFLYGQGPPSFRSATASSA